MATAIASARSTVPSYSARPMMTPAGAGANAALLLLDGDRYPIAVALRFATGAALAGVYPSVLKVMSGWFREGRGMALGVLVGALTVGSAGPHLIRGIGYSR